MPVLDLGCGFGGFAKFAAERYGVEVAGVTLLREQLKLGQELCAGLPVELHLMDCRDIKGTYDRVASIGLLEHVGMRNYRTYMEVVDRRLARGVISSFQKIATPRSHTIGDPWTTRYIFPNSNLPSLAQLGRAMEGLFILEDLQEIGPHYDPTLMAWHANFVAAWPELRAQYDERFYRMWTYYLLMSAAAFRTRHTQVFQAVITRPNTPQPDCRKS